jgi:hypothetical protein
MKKARHVTNEFDLGAEPWPAPTPPVLHVVCEKRYVVEGSIDKKNYHRLCKSRGAEFFDLIPGIRFYRVRRYGSGKYRLISILSRVR